MSASEDFDVMKNLDGKTDKTDIQEDGDSFDDIKKEKLKGLGNGIHPNASEKAVLNGILKDVNEELPNHVTKEGKLNGRVKDGKDELIDEEELLKDGLSDGVTENINEDILLKTDEDSSSLPIPNGEINSENLTLSPKDDINDHPKDTMYTDSVKSVEKDNVLETKFKNDEHQELAKVNKGVNLVEKMDVDDFKDADTLNEDVENLPPASRDDIIPSPIQSEEVTKNKRISDQVLKIEKLKEDLRCEEATLSLFRKLIDSQRGKTLYKSSSKHQSAIPSLHPKQQPTIAPKGTVPLTKQPPVQSSKPTSNQQPVQKYYIQVGNQLVPAPPPNNQGSGSAYQYSNGTTNNSHYQPVQQAKPPPPKQTPEQKQSAAKAALRRQLEQTLLQIPPPRPPPADWKCIPNVNSMDFMMLVGLDEVVDAILDNDSKPTLKSALEELPIYNPRVCTQCKVDFSPCWKSRDGDNKEFVLCERCSLQNVKKELKAEHTARLKSAFLKALKQEQEIEEKIKAGEDVNIGNITGSDKADRAVPSPHQQSMRISSPKTASSGGPTHLSNNHTPNQSNHHHQSSGSHHHRHQVVQHYPHHTSLVQQLHHQHIQQQQLELEPSSRHSSRWHPYMTSSSGHHHRDHHGVHHRSYVSASSSAENSPHQEYYVVHHPQHANVRYVSR